jgi:hypothetical protein
MTTGRIITLLVVLALGTVLLLPSVASALSVSHSCGMIAAQAGTFSKESGDSSGDDDRWASNDPSGGGPNDPGKSTGDDDGTQDDSLGTGASDGRPMTPDFQLRVLFGMLLTVLGSL